MYIAYDTYLETLVTADSVKSKTNEEPYRFICAYCGQDVIVAAKESDSQSVHFRHKHGNNDTECEEYLGRCGLTGLSTRIKHFYKDRQIEFYFSAQIKRLYLGIRFTDAELTDYQKSNSYLTIKSAQKSPPFLSRQINKTNFSANHTEKIGIDKYSNEYFIGTDNKAYRMYAVLNRSSPSFFKITETDPNIARYVKGQAIFTHSLYYVLLPSGNRAEMALKKIPSVEIMDSFTFKFDPFGETIYAVKVLFNEANDQVTNLLRQWEKKIEEPSILDLLWPPAFEYDESTYANTDKLFFYSSFQIEPKKNTNISDEGQIERLSENLLLVNNSNNMKIMRNNIDFHFVFSEYDSSLFDLSPKSIQSNSLFVPDQGDYYLFSNLGTQKLVSEQKVYLTPDSFVCEYNNSYLTKIFTFQGDSPLTLESLLCDMLTNYNVLVPFNGTIKDDYPEFLLDYLKHCKTNGFINAAVERCIEEGKF